MLVNLGKFFFKYRNGLFPAIYLLLVLFTHPGLFLGDAHWDRFISAAGVLIALVGEVFRMIVIGFAYIRRGGKDGKVYADSLVQSGFFAHVRNPMYVGNYLIMLGFVMLYGSIWAYLVVLPFFTLVYYSIVKNEEDYLKHKFSQEFEGYSKKVNRFIPNLKGLKSSLKQYEYDWRKVLKKEYGTIFVVLAGLLAIVIWKEIYFFGFENRRAEIWMLASLFIPVILFYGTIRYLKKRTEF